MVPASLSAAVQLVSSACWPTWGQLFGGGQVGEGAGAVLQAGHHHLVQREGVGVVLDHMLPHVHHHQAVRLQRLAATCKTAAGR